MNGWMEFYLKLTVGCIDVLNGFGLCFPVPALSNAIGVVLPRLVLQLALLAYQRSDARPHMLHAGSRRPRDKRKREWLIVNDSKFSAGTVFFSHTNQSAVLLHEPTTI